MDDTKRPNHDKERLTLGGRLPGDIRRDLTPSNPADHDRTNHAPDGARFPDNVLPFAKGQGHGNT